jgi:hypothetical protein
VTAADIDWRAVGAGAAVVAIVYLPLTLIYALSVDEATNVVFLLALPIIVLCVVGGYVTGTRNAETPMMHGAIAAGIGVAAGQVLGLVLHLAQDEPVRPVAIVFNLLLAANLGLLGGWLSTRRRVA